MTTSASSVLGSLRAPEDSSQAAAGAVHEVFVWPAQGIALLGALCVLIGLTYFAVRLRRARTKRGDV